MANPAEYPENGPERLFLERTPEAQRYDERDWPGSSSFHPPHLRNIFDKIIETSEEEVSDQDIPAEE